MSTRWEDIVDLARQVDGDFAKGGVPDGALVVRLAVAVREFQRQLAGPRVLSKTTPPSGFTGSRPVE